jgi:hypothetical protein
MVTYSNVDTQGGVAEHNGFSKMAWGSITFGDEYATAGVAVTIASLGLTTLEHLIVGNAWEAADGLLGNMALWNGSKTAPKILLFDCGADGDQLDELAAGQDTANGLVVHYFAIGT